MSRIPKFANVVSSHTLYKVKSNDNGELYMKARIVPHGNHDRMRSVLNTDANSCYPIGIRIVCSIATIFSWPLSKVDFDSAFLQSGASNRDVYVRPTRECNTRRNYYWLLLSASYGLVNVNSKWQTASDECLYEYGLQQLHEVPQLFYLRSNGKLLLAAAKVVDDILISAPVSRAKSLVKHICTKLKLGTIVYGPICFNFCGLKISPCEDMTVTVSAEKKMDELCEYTIPRVRRKQSTERLYDIERSHYQHVNGKLVWVGVIGAPLCDFAASHLQQKSPKATVHELVLQNQLVRRVKEFSSITKYILPPQKDTYEVNIVAFSDASKVDDKGQLGMISGLMLGELKTKAVYHSITWFYKKAKRPVKSVASAEVLGTGAAFDESVLLKHTYSKLLGISVRLFLVVDSKDLYDTISTKRLPTDKSIKCEVASLRYDFEIRAIDKIIWVPGKFNLADPLTKHDIPIEKSLQLTLYCGTISSDLSGCPVNNSDKPTG